MQSRSKNTLLLIAILITFVPWASAGGNSQDRSAGVAGADRVSRGKNDSVGAPRAGKGAPKPRYSEPDPVGPDETESTTRVVGARAREIESLEQQCLDEINRVRKRNGLQQLALLEELLPVARAYSRRMAEERFFSHDDPEGRSVKERIEEAAIKWRMVGENLAYSSGHVNPVAASLHGWMGSPGHRANILDPNFSFTAIGVWIRGDGTVYFTEIFLKQ